MDIYKLPFNVNFSDLYKLSPTVNSSITLYDKAAEQFSEKQIYRKYVVYGTVPEFNPQVKKSYMFLNKSLDIPNDLLVFWDFVKKIDDRYNQMVINYYDKNDYIEAHRDCTSKFLDKNSPILCINLNETDDIYNIRHMSFINVINNEITSIPLVNNSYFFITNNTTHKHFVGKGSEKRISITFRMIKEL